MSAVAQVGPRVISRAAERTGLSDLQMTAAASIVERLGAGNVAALVGADPGRVARDARTMAAKLERRGDLDRADLWRHAGRLDPEALRRVLASKGICLF